MGNIAKNLDSKFDLNATRNDGALGFFQRASPPNNNNKKKISSVWGPVPGPIKQYTIMNASAIIFNSRWDNFSLTFNTWSV